MRLIDDKILPFVPEVVKDEFSYILGIRKSGEKFVKDEFEDRIYKTAPKPLPKNFKEINLDEYKTIDGKALKYCDKLAAFFEAGISISYGVKSKELIGGFESSLKFFKDNPLNDEVDFYEICKDFMRFFDLKDPFSDGCGTYQA